MATIHYSASSPDGFIAGPGHSLNLDTLSEGATSWDMYAQSGGKLMWAALGRECATSDQLSFTPR